MTIEALKEQGYADYSELKQAGIRKTISLGVNCWGFQSRIIETVDGTQWDYIPEDQIYELRTAEYISVQ